MPPPLRECEKESKRFTLFGVTKRNWNFAENSLILFSYTKVHSSFEQIDVSFADLNAFITLKLLKSSAVQLPNSDTNYHFVHPNGRKIKYWLIRLGLDTISLLVMAHALIEKNSKNMREYHGS